MGRALMIVGGVGVMLLLLSETNEVISRIKCRLLGYRLESGVGTFVVYGAILGLVFAIGFKLGEILAWAILFIFQVVVLFLLLFVLYVLTQSKRR